MNVHASERLEWVASGYSHDFLVLLRTLLKNKTVSQDSNERTIS